MKKTLLAILCLAAVIAFATPGVLRPNVELFWTPNPTNENVSMYILYSKTDISLPWAQFTNIPNNQTNYFITPANAARYYSLTASNIWGESGFSPAVWIPQLPSSNGVFQVR